MKLLLDTNVILEVLLKQQNAAQVQELLAQGGEHEFFLSDYALHSIGNVLFRNHAHLVFETFLDDMILNGGIRLLYLSEPELRSVKVPSKKYTLDFDDAYQYAVAEKHNLTLVSFDRDFDRTERGRKLPNDILKK